MKINITPAVAMRTLASQVSVTIDALLPQLVTFCEQQMKEAAKKFGRTKVIIEYEQLQRICPDLREFDAEPVGTALKEAFAQAGYVVDTSHETFLAISCSEATHD